MSTEIRAEATGETVGEAKWAALRELERQAPNLDRDAVTFDVLSEGERGLLGVGYAPARVAATAPAPEPRAEAPAPTFDAPPGSAAERAVAIVERILETIDVPCSVRVSEHDDEIVVTLSGADLGLAIGRHGQTLDAMQYLANAIAHTQDGDDRKHVTVDAAGYRARRAEKLEALARRSAERAAGTGRRVELEPMTPIERKVVHEALKDDPEVETASEGSEPNRFVVVIPRRAVD